MFFLLPILGLVCAPFWPPPVTELELFLWVRVKVVLWAIVAVLTSWQERSLFLMAHVPSLSTFFIVSGLGKSGSISPGWWRLWVACGCRVSRRRSICILYLKLEPLRSNNNHFGNIEMWIIKPFYIWTHYIKHCNHIYILLPLEWKRALFA